MQLAHFNITRPKFVSSSCVQAKRQRDGTGWASYKRSAPCLCFSKGKALGEGLSEHHSVTLRVPSLIQKRGDMADWICQFGQIAFFFWLNLNLICAA